MDPALNLPPLNIPALLRAHNLRPRKSLGQNFLSNPDVLARVVESAGLTADEDVLEVGPGLGSLTRVLAARARWVVAVELDQTIIPVLKEVLSDQPHVTVIHGDILDFDPVGLLNPGYRVVANIPYYITSAVIRHLLECAVRPASLTLTVQREVAERICAAPGDLSLLALSVQVYGQPQVVGRIPAGAFYPPPNVDSAVVHVALYPEPIIPDGQLPDFFRLIKAGFSQKRKTLRNSLSGGLGWTAERAAALLGQADIDPQRRAETITLPEWERLTVCFVQTNLKTS